MQLETCKKPKSRGQLQTQATVPDGNGKAILLRPCGAGGGGGGGLLVLVGSKSIDCGVAWGRAPTLPPLNIVNGPDTVLCNVEMENGKTGARC